MKKSFYPLVVLILFLLAMNASAQTATSLEVNDTRDVSESPNSYGEKVIRADLKFLTTSGISTAYGFTTNLTISPGFNGTAGYISQLSFNNNGVFYRNGDFFSSSWNGWNKILMSDLFGNVNLEKLNLEMSWIIQIPHSLFKVLILLQVKQGSEILFLILSMQGKVV